VPERRTFEVVVEGLLALDLPEADAATIRDAAAAAAGHASGLPDLTAFGVRAAEVALATLCSVPARGDLAGLPPGRRGEVVGRFARLPVIGEYVRLARGLGLACYYDRAAR
jgi:hypothetical protein